MDQGSLSNPGVSLRDLIRREAQKQVQSVDQVALGEVSDAGDGTTVGVLLDGFAAGELPATWSSLTPPAVGQRVTVLSLKGGQSFYVVGVIGVLGGPGDYLRLDGSSTMAGDIEMNGNELHTLKLTSWTSDLSGDYWYSGAESSEVFGLGYYDSSEANYLPVLQFWDYDAGTGTDGDVQIASTDGTTLFDYNASGAAIEVGADLNMGANDLLATYVSARESDLTLEAFSGLGGSYDIILKAINAGTMRTRMEIIGDGDINWYDSSGALAFAYDDSEDEIVSYGNIIRQGGTSWAILTPSALELGSGQGSGGYSYIDLHANDSTQSDRAARFYTNETAATLSFTGGASMELGASYATFNKPVLTVYGAANAPGFSFDGDENSGVYRIADGQVGISANSSTVARFLATGIMNGGNATGGFFMPRSVGSAATPVYSFGNDTDTGVYRYGTNTIGWSTGGTRRMALDTSAWYGEGVTGAPRINTGAGAATDVTYGFEGDANTGMYASQADHLRVVGGGTDIIWGSATHIYFGTSGGATNVRFLGFPSQFPTTTNTSNFYASGTNGALYRITSALKYKKDVQDAEWLADIPLRPVSYVARNDETLNYGFIADEIAAALPEAGQYANDEIENFSDRAVMAVMAAKINRIEGEMAVLKELVGAV